MQGMAYGQSAYADLYEAMDANLITLRQLLALPHVSPVFLFDAICPKFAPWWQADSGAGWKTPETDSVSGLQVNGVSLTLAASEAAVIATAGTWYWDGAYVYAHLSDGSDPNNTSNVIQYFLEFFWSDRNYDINGHFWEGRVVDLPSLSLRIEPTFKAPTQTGGGSLALLNADNWFSSRKDDRYYQWSGGQITILMGAETLAWNQFVPISTQSISGLAPSGDKKVRLDMIETKARLNLNFPLVPYNTSTYPALRKEDAGRYIQQLYGTVYGINPVCIDIANRIFKVAGHAVYSIDAVRVNQPGSGNVWLQVNPTSFDLTNGQFTLGSSDWALGQAVAVDVRGLAKSDGTLMENPSSQISDLLSRIGVTNINQNSFNAAYAFYDVGYTSATVGGAPNPLYRVTRRKLGLYLDKQDTVLNIVNRMTEQIRAYFFSDALGRAQLVPFTLKQAKNLPLVSDVEALSNWQEQQPTATVNHYSSYTINYANHPLENYRSTVTYTRAKNQYLRQRPVAVANNFNSDFVTQSDALEYGQWLVNNDDLAPITYTYTGKWQPFTWMPGDQIQLTNNEESVQKVVQITSVTINLSNREITLTAQSRLGFDQCPGIWVGDGETTPAGNSLAWDGTERQYKTNNCGTWSTDQGYGMSSPISPDDKRVSTWS